MAMFGKKFKTLREAKKYLTNNAVMYGSVWNIYNLHSKVYKYFVGSHLEWLNL